MAHSQLRWEDVSQFEEIEGYGQIVWRHNGQYYFVTEEGGIAPQLVVYELSDELFQLLDSGQKTSSEIHFKLQNDAWPPTEEEKIASERQFIEEGPTALIANPESRKLFTREELERLMPIAEQQWIDWQGKLPDDYVSPLK
ncbi:Uncharacterised protein [Streptococcus gallolyticus]|uniref:Uncharacterized protein n=1 Tax=Streptococcus gallolyticus TaxID=315405 RepID=A0AA94SBR9_9STRE|nr:hypothetical protein [Streptococcus gallolyticus]AQP43056.1 hypothetical protein BTR42_10440 [Streptococcus gallolyticus subsp. gallolyticus DSM 16831]SQG80358.1 Uncharacterised protein [Streptococcus gallolyticus]